MLAHIRNGQVIRRYASEKGWITLESGEKASPPVAGYVNGNDKVVPVVEETVDSSTGSDTVTERSETVKADRVLRLTTIRDMTQAELDAKQVEFEAREATVLESPGVIRALLKAAFDHENRVRALEGRAEITMQQFANWVKGQL